MRRLRAPTRAIGRTPLRRGLASNAKPDPSASSNGVGKHLIPAVACTVVIGGAAVAYQYGDVKQWTNALQGSKSVPEQQKSSASAVPRAVADVGPVAKNIVAEATPDVAVSPAAAAAPCAETAGADAVASAEAAAATAAAETAVAAQAASRAAAAEEDEANAARARRESFLAAVNEAIDNAVASPLSQNALTALRNAISAAEAENLAAAAPLDTDDLLADARRRALDLEAKQREHAQLEAAHAELRSAMDVGDLNLCRSALASVLEQTEDQSCAFLLAARPRIEELEQLAREAARRAAAQEAMELAVQSRDKERCREALQEVEAANVPTSPAAELATLLTNPQRLHGDLLKSSSDTTAELRKAVRAGLVLQDVLDAAKAVAEETEDEEKLRAQVEDLARVIVRNYELQARDFEKELAGIEPALAESTLSRATTAAQRLNVAKDNVEKSRLEVLEEAAARRRKENETRITQETAHRTQAACTEVREGFLDEASLFLAHEAEAFESRVKSLDPPVQALEGLVAEGAHLHQRSSASNALSTTLMAFQAVLHQGRPAHAELAALREAGAGVGDDGFVARLLSLLPEETVDRSRCPVPTDLQLQRRFRDQLNDLVAGVFAPARADGNDGLLLRSASHIAGRIFGRLYLLRAHATDAPQGKLAGGPEGPWEKNLVALAKAQKLVERGELLQAVRTLEAPGVLTGECREHAQVWVSEVRNALLLQQVARAAQAKVRCLHAVLAS